MVLCGRIIVLMEVIMKKTLLKGITVLTLLLSLVFAFAGCGEKETTPSKPTETQKELAHKHIVSETEKNDALNFLKEVSNAFGLPFDSVKDKDAFFTTSGDISVNADPNDKTFVYDESKKMYINFKFQTEINKADVNKSKAMLKVTTGGTAGLKNGDEVVVFAYFDVASKNVLVSAKKGEAVLFEKNAIIGDVSAIAKENPIKPIDFSLEDIFDALDKSDLGHLAGEVIGSSFKNLYNQQILRLVARAMYTGQSGNLVKAFNVEGNKYSVSVDSNQVEGAVKDFFFRAGKIQNDEKYTPEKDFNTDNPKDVLDNNSDVVLKKFENLVGMLNALPEVDINISGKWGVWHEIFDLSDNAFAIKASFDKTDSGIENGNVSVNVKGGSTLSYPTKEGKKVDVVISKNDVNFELKNFNVSVSELGDSKVDTTGCDAEIARLSNLPSENLAKFNVEGKMNAKYDETTVKEFTYALDVDMNVFAFLTVNSTNGEQVVKDAIAKLNFTVKDVDTVVFSAVWNDENGTLKVTYANASTKDVTAKELADMIVKSKAKVNELGSKSLVDLINSIKIDSNGSIPNGFVVDDVNGTITIPAGIDKAIMGIFGLSYTDFIGSDLDIVNAIFPKVNEKAPTHIVVSMPVVKPIQ